MILEISEVVEVEYIEAVSLESPRACSHRDGRRSVVFGAVSSHNVHTFMQGGNNSAIYELKLA